MTESEKDAQARWILRQDLPICACKPTNKKHTQGWHCVTKEQLAAWKSAEHPPVLHPETAKRLASLWINFSQHPEARRLSGRVVTLEEADRLKSVMDLDAWDDAAGMTNLQRMMYE